MVAELVELHLVDTNLMNVSANAFDPANRIRVLDLSNNFLTSLEFLKVGKHWHNERDTYFEAHFPNSHIYVPIV